MKTTIFEDEVQDYGTNIRLIHFSGKTPSMREAVIIAYKKCGGLEPVMIDITPPSVYKGLVNAGSLIIRYNGT